MTDSQNGSVNKGRLVAAALVAVGLLLAGGAGYRALAQHLARPSAIVPLPPGTLASLPMEIRDWDGQDAPLDESVARATDSDAHISRRYSRHGGAQTVWLFLAYGVQARDLMPHRPEVCYPGAGWTLDDSQSTELALENGNKLQCRILGFSRSGLTAKTVRVLNYYIVDGQYCPDVSLLRSKAWRGSSGIRYMAQVQITCSGTTSFSPDSSVSAVRAFAVDSAQAILALLPDAIQRSDANHE